jgi:hypothetical protein
MWTVLLAAEPGSTYNVGSEEAVSIAELAERTARILRAPGVRILGRDDPGWNPGRYAPPRVAFARIWAFADCRPRHGDPPHRPCQWMDPMTQVPPPTVKLSDWLAQWLSITALRMSSC